MRSVPRIREATSRSCRKVSGQAPSRHTPWRGDAARSGARTGMPNGRVAAASRRAAAPSARISAGRTVWRPIAARAASRSPPGAIRTPMPSAGGAAGDTPHRARNADRRARVVPAASMVRSARAITAGAARRARAAAAASTASACAGTTVRTSRNAAGAAVVSTGTPDAIMAMQRCDRPLDVGVVHAARRYRQAASAGSRISPTPWRWPGSWSTSAPAASAAASTRPAGPRRGSGSQAPRCSSGSPGATRHRSGGPSPARSTPSDRGVPSGTPRTESSAATTSQRPATSARRGVSPAGAVHQNTTGTERACKPLTTPSSASRTPGSAAVASATHAWPGKAAADSTSSTSGAIASATAAASCGHSGTTSNAARSDATVRRDATAAISGPPRSRASDR